MALADTARLIASLELQDKFSRPAAGINRSLGGLERGFSQIGRGMGQVGRGLDQLGTRAALGAAAGIGAVVKTAIDFETAFTGVEKTVDATVPELAKMELQFRELARTIPLSFEEFAKIGELAGALGIAQKDIIAFTKVAAEIGVTTDVSSDQAATSLGVLSNVLKLTAKDYDNFGATLVDLGNKGASTESAILAIAERAGAGAALIGIAADETLGWASAIANLGIEPEAGGSSLQNFFIKSARLVSEGKDELKVFAETAGVSKKAFATLFDQDSSAALEQFVRGLGELEKSERLAVLAALGFKDIRISRALLGLAGDTDNLTGSLNTSNKAWEDNTALTVEAEKRYATVASQLTLVKNNVRDAANTIGIELLPIVSELSKEFVTFLNQADTQKGLKTFAKDLAEGIRGLVTELKGTDFSGIIGGLKLAASVAKGAFDAFNALPGPVKQFAIAALVANKVSGGAVGSIAKGLANIVGGVIKVAFPKLDIFGRGSPANPMFTKEIGLGGVAGGAPIAGGAAAAGGGFLKGVLAGASKLFGVGAAVYFGAELGKFVAGGLFEQTVAPAVEFETSRFDKFIAAAEGDAEALQRGLLAVEDGIHDIAGNTVDPLERWLIPQLATLEEQRDILRDLLAKAPQAGTGNFVPTNPGGTPGTTLSVKVTNADEVQEWDERNFNRAAAAENRQAAQFAQLTLEQRLIKDAAFKQQIGQAEFLRLLRKTSEFGAKGEGTTIEVGPKTGRDPLGDAFVALVKRVPKNLLTGEVYREVANHIVALEEVQKGLLADGNTRAASHAQRNIDKLSALIGTVDRTRPILERTASLTSALSARMTEARAATDRGFSATNASLGSSNAKLATIAGKDFSPNLAVNVAVTSNVSISDIQRRVTSQQIAIGRGPLEFIGNG